jgi:hypothetical protein
MAGDGPVLVMMKSENDTEMKIDTDKSQFHTVAKDDYFRMMGQGSEHLHTTKKESRTENKQRTAGGYISDQEKVVKASYSLFQQDGVAVYGLSKRSPLPPPMSGKDLTGRRTEILNVC